MSVSTPGAIDLEAPLPERPRSPGMIGGANSRVAPPLTNPRETE
jgi:hypothetical protein